MPGASLRPHLAFNPRLRRLSTPADAFQLHHRCVAVLEGHAGCVNDLKAPRQSPGTLLSASSDRTVKAWRIGGDSDAHGAEGEPSQPRCVATMERHDDYVMALATPSRAGGREHFASGGLGADNVYLCVLSHTGPHTTALAW